MIKIGKFIEGTHRAFKNHSQTKKIYVRDIENDEFSRFRTLTVDFMRIPSVNKIFCLEFNKR